MNKDDRIILNNGVEMPIIGYGTFRTPAGEICENGVLKAIEAGYRLIDTATCYNNEDSVGTALKRSDIDRADLFVTTKLWNPDQGYDSTLKAFDVSMSKLGLEYLDLYLIHWPIPFDFREIWQQKIHDTWKAFERLYQEGRVRAIGVSNFMENHLEFLENNCNIMPMVDQFEYHIGLNRESTFELAKSKNIVVEAWAPICKGKSFDLAEIQSLSRKYAKTPPQIMLRWCLQKGVVPIPKSVTPSRIAENIDIFDFSLNDDEMDLLSGISESVGAGRLGSDPNNCAF